MDDASWAFLKPGAFTDSFLFWGLVSQQWTRNSSSFQAPRRIFTLPARHCELNGPNLVSFSPLSRAGSTLKPLSAGTRQKAWFLPACRPQPFRYVWVANNTLTGVDKAAAAR